MIREVALRLPLLLLVTGVALAIAVAKGKLPRRAAYLVQVLLLIGTAATAFVIQFDNGPDDSRMFYVVSALMLAAIGGLFIAAGAAVRERNA